MLLVKKDTFSLDSSSRLVKAADVASVAKIDEVMAAAHKEGYDKGFAEGKMEIAMQQLDLLESSVSFMEDVEDKMVDIVLKAMRKCVDEIGNEDLVIGITRKAMKAVVRNQQQITLRTSPAMVGVVKARMNELMDGFPSLNFIDVVEDTRLDDKSCVVETAAGTVDASIEVQLAAIEKSIRKNFSKN